MNKKMISICLVVCMMFSLTSFMWTASASSVTFNRASIKAVLLALRGNAPHDAHTRAVLYNSVAPYFETNLGVDTLIGVINETVAVPAALTDFFNTFTSIKDHKTEITFFLKVIRSLEESDRQRVFTKFKARETVAFTTDQAAAVDRLWADLGILDNSELLDNLVTSKMVFSLLDAFNGKLVFTDDSSVPNNLAIYSLNSTLENNLNANLAEYTNFNNTQLSGTVGRKIINLLLDAVNTDSESTSALKKDYKLVFDAVGMYHKRSPGPNPGPVTIHTPTPTPTATASAPATLTPMPSPTTATAVVSGQVSGGVGTGIVTLPMVERPMQSFAPGGNNFLDVEVEFPAGSTINEYNITFKKDAFDLVSSGKVTHAHLHTNGFSYCMSEAILKSIVSQATTDVIFKIKKIDNPTLTDEAKAVIGSRPVYELSISSGGKDINAFGGNQLALFIPYSAADGEVPDGLFAEFIDEKGNVVPVPLSNYDTEHKFMVVYVSHLSLYGIGYKNVDFTDTKNNWSENHIKFLAARGIVNGMGDNLFVPDNFVTRAEFVKMISLLFTNDFSAYKTSSFSDVDANAWYAPYVDWATKNGIILGMGDGTFAPDAKITREQMAIIVARVAAFMRVYLPADISPISFKDGSEISEYAKEAVAAVQMAGIVSGRDTGVFDPHANATRAESAKIISNLVRVVVKCFYTK